MPTYQLKLTLKGSKPVIWRRILTPSNLLLPSFHEVIQIVMEWGFSNPHKIIYKDKDYGTVFIDAFDTLSEENYTDTVFIDKLLKRPKDKIIYVYDFEYHWEMDIELEKILTGNELKYPVFVDGKMGAPPEECGGISEFNKMGRVLNDPKHRNHDYLLDQYGDFNPNRIDIEYITDCLTECEFQYVIPKTAEETKAFIDRIVKIRELVNRFCEKILTDEYKQTCNLLPDDLVNDTDILNYESKTEVAAFAIVTAVGELNFLNNPMIKDRMSKDQINEWFGANEFTVSDKINEIYDELEMYTIIGPYALPSIANNPIFKQAYNKIKHLSN